MGRGLFSHHHSVGAKLRQKRVKLPKAMSQDVTREWRSQDAESGAGFRALNTHSCLSERARRSATSDRGPRELEASLLPIYSLMFL